MPGDDDLYRLDRPRQSNRRLLIGLLLLLFIAVLGGGAWWLTHRPSDETATTTDTVAATQTGGAGQGAPATQASDATGLATADAADARLSDLEQRVARISVAAQAASGYANRAEAIMVAFAARRALDAGQPLGYLEGQLRVLFNDAQPKAVATIINAASDPVTTNKLRAGLEDINLLVAKGDPKEGWWSAATRMLGNLVVVRHAGTPSPEPEQRLARARRAVEAGQIEDAITDMTGMPSQPAIAQWLDQARRYNEAHRALDVIEAAAILEPRVTPAVTAPPAATPAAAKPDEAAAPAEAK